LHVADYLMLLAALPADQGHAPLGAQLSGVTAALRDAHDAKPILVDLPYNERMTNAVHDRLSLGEMARLVALGRECSPDELLAEAVLALAATLVAGNQPNTVGKCRPWLSRRQNRSALVSIRSLSTHPPLKSTSP
jgi:hypothetical protein